MSDIKSGRKRKENFDHSTSRKEKYSKITFVADSFDNENAASENNKKKCDAEHKHPDTLVMNGNTYSKMNATNGDVDIGSNSSNNESSEFIESALHSFHAKFSKLKCENSIENEKVTSVKHVCFACKGRDDNVKKCSVLLCDKFYHGKCLEKLPTPKMETGVCPLHICLTCYNINPRSPQISKGQMYKCFKCPTAFHTKDECNIPGSVILTHDMMSCPDHFSPEQQREYPAVMNLFFCVQCGCNENLIFCSFCPLAVHKECLKAGTFVDKKYVCERCESRKVMFYDDIVWAKVYNFQWWPAKVLNPKNIPSEVQKLKHYEGEFPVQFFGTDEYFWVQKGRVFPFTYKEIGIEDNGINHNFKKRAMNVDFDNALKLAYQALDNKKILKLAEPSNHKKPAPYKHIKTNRPVGDVQIFIPTDMSDFTTCGCEPEDPNPCGYGTLCLNRNMCSECHPDVCEAGNLCQNQKFQKREYAAVKPFCTSNRGWGLKCLEDIKKGHFVIEYVGDLIDEEECERRIEEKQACGDDNFYFCTLDSNRIIDAGPKGNFSRFLNHSCDPNCETQKWIVNGDGRVGVFARKDIPVGTELTFDYQMDFSHNKKLKCNCGSQRCSGLIGKKPQNGVLKKASAQPKMKEVNQSPNLKPKKSQNESLKKGKALCFKCKKGGKQISCIRDSCGKSFHVRCLGANSGKKLNEYREWECPHHFCKKCEKVSEYQCFTCPNAYCNSHVSDHLIKRKIFACPKHVKSY